MRTHISIIMMAFPYVWSEDLFKKTHRSRHHYKPTQIGDAQGCAFLSNPSLMIFYFPGTIQCSDPPLPGLPKPCCCFLLQTLFTERKLD